MKLPDFSRMTVDALLTARKTIDDLLAKRVPRARKELEDRLNALNNYFSRDSRDRKAKGRAKEGAKAGTKAGAKPDGRSKLKGRPVPPKYRSPDGETWAGRGMKPRWLAAAIKQGADLEDFAIGAGGRRKKASKKAAGKRKKAATKRPAAKRKAAKPARKKAAPEAPAPAPEAVVT
jgi:DNA-binding protein H-NS